MSTGYRTEKRIRYAELFDGRLEKYGVRERINKEQTSDDWRCLTDGDNFLWTYASEDGMLQSLTRYMPNGAPGKILQAISDEFETEIYCEYQPQYWGFETEQEWDEWQADLGEALSDEFYDDILKFLSGEKDVFVSGTTKMERANIAKELAAEIPEALPPEWRYVFMCKVFEIQTHGRTFSDLTEDEKNEIRNLFKLSENSPESFEDVPF